MPKYVENKIYYIQSYTNADQMDGFEGGHDENAAQLLFVWGSEHPHFLSEYWMTRKKF